jgi:thiamine-phosphate pyrophosphorylase
MVVPFATLPGMDDRHARLRRAHLYFICDIQRLTTLGAALRGGADIFQLRDKHASDAEVLRAAETARAACSEHGALFVVNDRPDLAVAAGADGVHLGQDDMDMDEARAIVGEEMLIGRSTHSPAQIDAAAGADYIGVGPIHETPTKQWRFAVGLDLVRYAAANAAMPFFAIGGLDTIRLREAVAAGATRAAVVRAICAADDPETAARLLRAELPVEHSVG